MCHNAIIISLRRQIQIIIKANNFKSAFKANTAAHASTQIKLIVQQFKAQLPDIASTIKMLQFKQRTKLKRFRRTSDSQRFLTIRVKYFQTKHQISRILLIIQRKRIRRTQDSLRYFMSKQNDSRLELKSKRKMIDQESLNDFQLNSYNN